MKWRLFKLDWKYAIGELVIVTLGIMIALYADQRSSQQSFEESEVEYIERLITDLEEDQRRIEIAIDFLETKNSSLSIIHLNLCAQAQPDGKTSELVQHFGQGAILGFSQPFARSDTYNEMLATGRLNLLADANIRTDLMTYHADNERFMNRTQARETSYPSLFFELVPPSTELRVGNSDEIWERVESADVCNAVRAEMNFGSFMEEQYGEWQERKSIFLGTLTNYLAAISG